MITVLIAGGTGFVGKALVQHLSSCGYRLHVLTRSKELINTENIHYFEWDISKGFIDENAFNGVSKIINLTGANIGEKRWSEKRKIEIIESRTKSINLLFQYVKDKKQPITTFISSSAVGYYGAITSNQIFTENSSQGNDFLASVCEQWESAALQFQQMGIPTVILRKGVVLGKDGGMYQKLAPIARLGISTSLGKGHQYLPWIEISDLTNLYSFLLQSDDINGVFNVVSSEHTTMNDFSKALLQSFDKSSFLPNTPSFMIKLMFGELSVMLLEGSRIDNEKLKQTGFSFKYESLTHLFGSKFQ